MSGDGGPGSGGRWGISGWTYAKYVLALAGLALVLLADNLEKRWLGYPGLALILAAFLLRFVQQRAARRDLGERDAGR